MDYRSLILKSIASYPIIQDVPGGKINSERSQYLSF
jgi:hypothetical protein